MTNSAVSIILSKKSSNIKKINDLRGKVVISTAGTVNLKQSTAINTERSFGMTVLSTRDHAEAFLVVETDRATAFAMDGILLTALAATEKPQRASSSVENTPR
ncbi:transporter substrate-binding domain-containing protein [Herbaspirillum sp. 1130]|uniref:transporter substrate-binding domain-containing protein n=1 Tax=Herbaspirillum sp. 1130 TaxID=2806562 RepID=UPI001AE775B1|nr:transporter substrate-binding domain-containing protein [Herbaspirillum sp. 1130]MBP1318287.1 ABC-type amino acid transport substrate-binding protein [Herbaspirillum sp. 1130]